MCAGSPQPQPQRLLVLYLFGLCVYQIALYFWPGGPPFVLDPRAGIPVFLINHFSFDNRIIYRVEWLTASWLVFMACAILVRGRLLKIYAIVELVMAAPTAYYIAVLAHRHGGDFAPGLNDLLVTVLLFVLFSLVPLAWVACLLLWRKVPRITSAG
jgi:hypothetical protein